MIFSVTTIALYSLVTKASAGLGLISRVAKGVRTPLQQVNPVIHIPQGRPVVDLQRQSVPWNAMPWRDTSPVSAVMAAAAARAVTTRASSGTNIFGEKLQGCVDENDLCEYSEESPNVCVKSGKIQFRFACKSMYTASWKNRIVAAQRASMGDEPKCEAVPAEALDSPYSKTAWDSYWGTAKVLKDVMRDDGVVESLKEVEVPKKTRKGAQFRKGIDYICGACADAAVGGAKSTLEAKCKAIGWTPEGYEGAVPAMFAQASPSVISNLALVMIGLLMGSGVTFMMLRFRAARYVTKSLLSEGDGNN